MARTKSQNQLFNQVFMYLSIIVSVILIAIGSLALWAHNFTNDMVRNELSAQKIYFPEAGSASFDAETYPDIQQYAGQLVDTPEEAKAYANGYIGRHLQKIANGKVYAEVSAEAQKDPANETLQKQKQTLFQGETLRGILLTSGYGFGTVGKIAGIAAYVAFAGSVATLALAIILRTKKS